MSDQILATIKSRRVIREMSDKPVDREHLEKIIEAGRWAPAAGNQRTIRFIVVQDSLNLKLIRMFSPGMFQRPQAIILFCIDSNIIRANQFSEKDPSPFIDLGATMQTMMLAAHGIGLGSGPVTSFSKEAIRVILKIPSHLRPEMMIPIGYQGPKPQLPMRTKKRVTWQSLTVWEHY